jgi:ABC-type uncharacterized transport system permease subunit
MSKTWPPLWASCINNQAIMINQALKQLRLVFMIARASFKQQTKTPASLLTNIATPTIFASVFLLQFFLIYQINPQPFAELSLSQFFACFFATQIILFFIFDRSLNRMRQAILTSDLDFLLLRPINLFFFKYLRHLDVQIPYILVYSVIGLGLSLMISQTPLLQMLKLAVFIVMAGLIRSNTYAIAIGLNFFSRDGFGVREATNAATDLTINRPPEIFPTNLRFVLTFVLPLLVVNSFVFDLVRGRDSAGFWLITLAWLGLSWLGNVIVWQKGLERYESIG